MRIIERCEMEQVGAGNATADCLGFAANVGAVGLTAPGTPANAVAGVAAVASAMSCMENVATGPAPASVDSCAVSESPEGGSVCTTASDSDGGGGSGSKVICTELCRAGEIDHEVWLADIRYSRQNFSERTMRGYHLWGVPYVRWMRRYPVLASLAKHPTRWFAEDIAFQMGVRQRRNLKGWVLREMLFRPLCSFLGVFAKARDWRALWSGGDGRLDAVQ